MASYKDTAHQCWTHLMGTKQPMLLRLERYAQLTIPKICLPNGYVPESTDEAHDYQSIGAQAVNHLTNRAMLALFAPSRPFFRLQLGNETQKEMAAAGTTEDDLAPVLAKTEREAVKLLDERGQRPKLYTTLRHLIVTGNVLMVLGKDDVRVMGIKYYCVKRDSLGRVYTLIIKECLQFDELEQAVQDAVPQRYTESSKVDYYKMICRQPNGDYTMTQWIDTHKLPKQFDGKWSEEKLPYRVLTWDLADESDYGTGLVEEYSGDLEALSVLSESVVDGAVLGTELRYLINPTGPTDADDFAKSVSGDAIAGKKEDIDVVQGQTSAAITVADAVMQRYEKRVSMGFLMQSGVTRDAERVTAEEIRLTAQQLETSFGGVYSTLALSIQYPIARWLLKANDTSIEGTDIKISIVTGLDALSRNGDLENLRQALNDLAEATNLPEPLLARLKFDKLAQFVGDGRGVDLRPFLKSDEEFQAEMERMQQARVQEAAATSAGEAQGQASVEQGQPTA